MRTKLGRSASGWPRYLAIIGPDLGVRRALGHLVAGVHVIDAVGMVRRLRAACCG